MCPCNFLFFPLLHHIESYHQDQVSKGAAAMRQPALHVHQWALALPLAREHPRRGPRQRAAAPTRPSSAQLGFSACVELRRGAAIAKQRGQAQLTEHLGAGGGRALAAPYVKLRGGGSAPADAHGGSSNATNGTRSAGCSTGSDRERTRRRGRGCREGRHVCSPAG